VTFLEFSLNLPCNSDKLFQKITDFENFNQYIPNQLESVKVLKKDNNKTVTEEKIRSISILKNSFEQTSAHTVKKNEIETEIISGPAKGTIIESFFQNLDSGTEVIIKINLKLSLKYKLFTPIVKKTYRQMLTGVLYKMNKEIDE
jgi:ribosome-associated toxin RatA of RatAB toxin-antitoxin module